MDVTQVDTPVPLVDLDAFTRNSERIATALQSSGRSWRPHVKAHKAPRLAQLQLECGAVGITCAKVGEAEVMVASGLRDVLVANELALAGKWRRVARLQRDAEVSVCVDDPKQIRMASDAAESERSTIPLLIEVDLGMRRTGVRSVEAALELARLIASARGTCLRGVMGYEGHIIRLWPSVKKESCYLDSLSVLTTTADLLRASGYPVEVVSAGGTGTLQVSTDVPGLTESQAGGGCLMDRFYREVCHVDLESALTVATTVVSTSGVDHAVVDAGYKTMGMLPDFPLPLVVGRPDITVAKLSAEHGLLETRTAGLPLHVGDRLELLPAYSDAMLVLHDCLMLHRRGVVTEVVELSARGCLT